jgi:hypothetical protein
VSKQVTYKKLSESRQEEILDTQLQILSEDWDDPFLEGFKEDLKEFGFNGIDIKYTGFWSQGDGASFTASSLNLKEFYEKTKDGWDYPNLSEEALKERNLLDGVDLGELADLVSDSNNAALSAIEEEVFTISIIRYHNYYVHENSIRSNVKLENLWESDNSVSDWKHRELNEEDMKEVDKFFSWLERYLDTWVSAFSKEMYNTLSKGYDEFVQNCKKDLENSNILFEA